MKNVRIYKDDIRQHILRSLFFTDSTIFLVGGVFIAGSLYFLLNNIFHAFNWNMYLASLIVLEIAFVGFITQRIDNQPIYKIFPRAIMFKKGKKTFRQKELEPYFVDFTIQDNLIIRKNSIIQLLEVEPFDISLLNDQDREHFFLKLKQMLHVLPDQVQFIVKKEQAKTQDYSKHFFSLYAKSNTKREPLIAQYIENLTDMINESNFTATKHYAVFTVSCNPTKPNEKLGSMKKLHDMTMRFSSALFACNIQVRALGVDELISFAKQTLR
ncbi:MAG: PrgI family protein [Candidatus Roizmanbacteria bacterium]|nr:PrgI family protein [Candidatus Roizmanbacteria bacterium]